MPAQVLGITGDSVETARKWLKENEVSLNPAIDSDKSVKHIFNTPGETFPKTIIIGKDGIIKEAFQFDGYPHRIRDLVKTML